MSGSGIYIRNETRKQEHITALLLEAAYLSQQADSKALVWSMIATALALHRMAELDEDQEILAKVTVILNKHRIEP